MRMTFQPSGKLQLLFSLTQFETFILNFFPHGCSEATMWKKYTNIDSLLDFGNTINP